MNSLISKIEPHAPLILRYGMGFVFIWFGYGSFVNPYMWSSVTPKFMTDIIPIGILIRSFAVFEIICAFLLFARIYARFVSFILALSLIFIITLLSSPETIVRDLGIIFALLSLSLTKEKEELV